MEIKELHLLEEKVQVLLDYCRTLEDEKTRLEDGLAEKDRCIEELNTQVDSLRQEREAVRGRVSSLISKIDQLSTLVQPEDPVSNASGYQEPINQ